MTKMTVRIGKKDGKGIPEQIIVHNVSHIGQDGCLFLNTSVGNIYTPSCEEWEITQCYLENDYPDELCKLDMDRIQEEFPLFQVFKNN